MNIRNWFGKNGSTILTCLGAGGMIATVVLAVRATPRAMKACFVERVKKGDEELTVFETVKAGAPAFVSTALCGTATLVCIFGANVLDKRHQASIATAYVAIEGAYQAYRGKVDQIFGPGTDRMIQNALAQEERDAKDDRPPWDENQTFYLDILEKPAFFERTKEQILMAEYEVNRYFRLKGSITVNEFLAIMELEPVPGGDLVGWDDYIGEIAFGYQWIDFEHRYFETDDGLTVCSIDLPFPPHPLNDEDFEWKTSGSN